MLMLLGQGMHSATRCILWCLVMQASSKPKPLLRETKLELRLGLGFRSPHSPSTMPLPTPSLSFLLLLLLLLLLLVPASFAADDDPCAAPGLSDGGGGGGALCPVSCFRPDPVCGADGVTYWCGCAEAACAGARVAKRGFCGVASGGSGLVVSGQVLLLVHIVWLILVGFAVLFGFL